MNRGSDEFVVRQGRMLAGFNEAPIHESGKSSKTWTFAALIALLQ